MKKKLGQKREKETREERENGKWKNKSAPGFTGLVSDCRSSVTVRIQAENARMTAQDARCVQPARARVA